MSADDSAASASGDRAEPSTEAGQSGLANTDRLVTLSDGVVAIALTLIILGSSAFP